MGRLISVLTLLFVVASSDQVLARGAADAALQAEVLRGFEKILDLWRDGGYEDLYDRTYGGREIRGISPGGWQTPPEERPAAGRNCGMQR